jgi:hypothetical protein
MENEEHTNGIKKSIETIIGADTVLKRKRKSEEDIHRDEFIKIIQTMDEIQVRSNIINIDLKLSFYEYDEKFYEVIDRLFTLQYGKEATELIFFYIYERLNPDGTVNSLQDSEGNDIIINTPFDLWFIVDKLRKKKK